MKWWPWRWGNPAGLSDDELQDVLDNWDDIVPFVERTLPGGVTYMVFKPGQLDATLDLVRHLLSAEATSEDVKLVLAGAMMALGTCDDAVQKLEKHLHDTDPLLRDREVQP